MTVNGWPGVAVCTVRRTCATTPWRGRPLAEALLMLPLLLPPTVIGFYLLDTSLNLLANGEVISN